MLNNINLRINYLAEEFFNGNNVKFANLVGSSEANIRNYRKNGQPKLEYIVKTCEVLKINFEWLLTGNGEISNNDYSEKEEVLQKVKEPQEEIYEKDNVLELLKKQNSILEKLTEFYINRQEKKDSINDRLEKLENFQKAVILKFKIDLEIERTEEEILLDNKTNKINK